MRSSGQNEALFAKLYATSPRVSGVLGMSFEVNLETLPGIQDDLDHLTAAACRAFAGWGNAEVGSALDPIYFERILIRTLIKIVPVLYWEIQTGDHPAIERVGAETTLGLGECVGIDFPTFNHKVMRSDQYHLFLRRLLAARTAKQPLPSMLGGSGKQRVDAPLLSVGKRIAAIGCRTLLYRVPLTRGDQLRLELLSLGKVNSRFQPDMKYDLPGADAVKRAALQDHLSSVSVDDLPTHLQKEARIIFDLLAYLLPVENVEALTTLIAWACAMADVCQPQTLVTGYGFFDRGAFPYYAAECAARGTEIIGWQHGGTYGEFATPGRIERWERRISDKYLTWGWIDGNPKVFDMPCPRQQLFQRKRKPREAPARLLWVSTADSRFTHFIDHTPVGERLKGYFRHQDAILAKLPAEIVARLVLRPNRNDFGWGLAEMWAARLNKPTFSPAGSNILDEADRCGLVLIDYPGSTTFLECLAARIPFICVIDPAVYHIRPSQAVAFEALEQTGVVHLSYDTAAAELSEALDDPEAWQNEPVRREAFVKAQEVVMRRDPSYIRAWRKVIN